MRVAVAFSEEPAALALRVLVGRDVAGMLGMQRRHQPVEEAPPLGRAVEEQPVELRRQPYRGDVLAQRGLALHRPAVDAHGAARRAALAAPGFEAGADGQPALGRVERRGGGPAGGRRFVAAATAADIVEPCPSQAAAGGQEGEGFQKVGLARAVGADQHDRLLAALEAKLAVVAEVGQAKLAHGEKGRRSARYGVGRVGEGADGLCVHTRIGMST